jgi:CheY-like chemotaxis protein
MMDPKPFALIIEDYEDQSLVFAKALDQAGYKTEVIRDGITAQKRLAEVVPAMVILDLHIPDIKGDVILRQIRSDQRLENVRVILATADAAFASDLQTLADLVLLKPISFAQLSQLANRFLDHL